MKNGVLTKEMVRESKDEEIVADLVAYMALPEVPRSSSDVLDQFYGLKESPRQKEIETALQKVNPDILRKRFLKVYDQIRQVLEISQCTFSELIFSEPLQIIPRYFQIIFLSIYDLMFKENMEIKNHQELADKLKNIGEHIKITTGGNWSIKNKSTNINAVKGIIRYNFKIKEQVDPATDSWLTEFETLLTQSRTEQTLFDFKQGFTRLDGRGELDENNFNKIIKTLTAMANHSPSAIGYVCIGVADNEVDANRIENLYKISTKNYQSFHITGIGHEATRLTGNLDSFFRLLIQKVQSQPIDQSVKDNIGRNIKIVNYYGKDVVVFCIKAGQSPVMYDNRYYQRIGANVEEVKPEGFLEFFRKFT
ncbi:MAG: RNA-binding domain-containing protein [Gloeotrichia echinulata CP02]